MLRAHGLIRKRPRSHRYDVSPNGPADPERHPFGSRTHSSTNYHLRPHRSLRKILRALRRTVRSVIPIPARRLEDSPMFRT